MSETKKALFFVHKPLELLGAIEAVKQFNIDDAILVYSSKSNSSDKRNLEFLIGKAPVWKNVIFVKRKPYYGYFWVKLINNLKKINFDYLFTRAFPVSAYFVHNLNFKEHILLDDGMATINISKEFCEHQNLTKRFSLFEGINREGVKYKLIEKIYSLLGICVKKPIKKIIFFTFYDLPQVKNQTVYLNKMEWVNAISKSPTVKQIDDRIFIIGTNVCGAKAINEGDYLNTIKKIKKHYGHKSLVYVPHPKESKLFLKRLENIGISIKINKWNIELDFFLNNESPTHVAGTISTALITLKLIYGNSLRVDYFNFEEKAIIKKNNNLKEIYNYQDKYLNKVHLKY